MYVVIDWSVDKLLHFILIWIHWGTRKLSTKHWYGSTLKSLHTLLRTENKSRHLSVHSAMFTFGWRYQMWFDNWYRLTRNSWSSLVEHCISNVCIINPPPSPRQRKITLGNLYSLCKDTMKHQVKHQTFNSHVPPCMNWRYQRELGTIGTRWMQAE